MKPAPFFLAAAVAVDLCCTTDWNQVACTTDINRAGVGNLVKLNRDKKGQWTATVHDHMGIKDGTYKCLDVTPVGKPVF